MEKGKKSETLTVMASAIWATASGPVRNQAQCYTIIFTHCSTPAKGEKKKSFYDLSPLFFFIKKKHTMRHILLDFKACLERSCAPHFRVKLAFSKKLLIACAARRKGKTNG